MKKFLGNGMIKKVIVTAMSAMLVLTTPAIPVTAAAETAVVDFNDIANGNGIDKDSIREQIDDALKDTDLSEEQKDLLKDLGGDLSQLDTTKDSYDVVDDAKDIINNDVTKAVDKETSDAANAAAGAEKIASDASGKYNDAASQVKNGENSTETLLKNDQNIVKDVEGNTILSTDEDGNETKLVNTIDENGKIILNVEDTDGNKVGLTDYTAEKANVAKDAAKTVGDVVNDLPNISNVNEARNTINSAIDKATTARDEAKTAYDAANSVLTDEMKRYNAYAKFYGLSKDQYSSMDDNNTPEFTEEEYNAFLAAEGLTMTKEDITNGYDAISDSSIKDALADQAAEIEAAKTLVDSCSAEIDEANGAIDQIVNAEQALVSRIQGVIDQATEQLKTATGFRKTLLEATIKGAQATLDTYNKVDMGQDVHPTKDDPNGTNPDTFKNRFDYTISQAKDLSSSLENMVDQATENVNDSQARYEAAWNEYQKILNQYNSLSNNKISGNLDAIELKLKNAKSDLDTAGINLAEAEDALKTATDLKDQFERSVANSGNNSGSNGSGSGSSDSTSGSAATVTITDSTTPLADGITDGTGADTTTINDEATALLDSVPKTGDSSASAMPFALGAFAAFAGAFITRMKRKGNN